jgi:hypothetical protein
MYSAQRTCCNRSLLEAAMLRCFLCSRMYLTFSPVLLHLSHFGSLRSRPWRAIGYALDVVLINCPASVLPHLSHFALCALTLFTLIPCALTLSGA